MSSTADGGVPGGDHAPLFSVVVPTYRRGRQLGECLASLSRLEYPASRYEVIVVEDDGRGLQGEAVRSLEGAMRVRHIFQSHAGAAAARNLGAAAAEGEYLAFTDDDCLVPPGWLGNLARAHRGGPPGLVGGRVVNGLERNICAEASQQLVDYLLEYYNSRPGDAVFLTSNNMSAPRDLFTACGGFDTAFSGAGGEDRELCYRWRRLGHPCRYDPGVTVTHRHLMSLRSFVRQHYSYGRGAAVLRRRSLERGYGPIRVEPWSFYADLLRFPLRDGGGLRAGALAALLVVAQAANGLGFFAPGRPGTFRR